MLFEDEEHEVTQNLLSHFELVHDQKIADILFAVVLLNENTNILGRDMLLILEDCFFKAKISDHGLRTDQSGNEE